MSEQIGPLSEFFLFSPGSSVKHWEVHASHFQPAPLILLCENS